MLNPLYVYRAAHWLAIHDVRYVPSILTRINYFLTGCDIGPRAIIGKRVHMQHYGAGVIIHQAVEIGDDVWIMPHVVLGQNIHDGIPAKGMFIKIGNRVLLGAGAKIIATGSLEIGDGAAIGANAVVLKSVPPNMIAVGVPARILGRKICVR